MHHRRQLNAFSCLLIATYKIHTALVNLGWSVVFCAGQLSCDQKSENQHKGLESGMESCCSFIRF